MGDSLITKRTRSQVIKYASGLGSHGAGTLIALGTQVFFARVMGPAAYGVMALTLAIILLPADLASLGMEPATARFIAVNIGARRFANISAIVRQSAVFMFVAGLALTIALLILTPHLAKWFDMPNLNAPLWTLSMFVPVIYAQKWSYMVLKGLGHITLQITLQSSLLQFLTLCFGAGLWLTYHSVNAVILGYGLAYAVVAVCGLSFVFYILWQRSIMRHAGNFNFREILYHGIPLNITALAQRLLRRGDTFVIGALLGASSLGVYRSAYMLASGIKQALVPINSYALFYMSKYFGKKQMDDVFSHYVITVLISLTLALPVYLLMFLLSDELVVWIFKSEYKDAIPLLQVLVIGFSIFVCVGPMGALFNAIGRNWLRMWMVLGISLLNIGLNIIFIKWVGLVGAAVGTSVSFAALYGLFLLCTKEHLVQGIDSFIPLLLVVFMVVVAVVLKPVLPSHLGGQLAVSVAGALGLLGISGFITIRYYNRLVRRTLDKNMKEGSQ